MKKLLLNVLFVLGIAFISTGQEFANCENMGEDECVVYVYRLKSMMGGAVKWPVSTMIYNEQSGEFIKKEAVKQGKINKLEYMPVILKANTFYWISIGEGHAILFAGTKGSETVLQIKGVKSATAGITGEALTRTNSESGFKIAEGDFNNWAIAIKNADSFSNIDISGALMEYGFETLTSDSNPELYEELKTMKKVKK